MFYNLVQMNDKMKEMCKMRQRSINNLHIKKPNLLHLAEELSKSSEPYKMADGLLLLVKSSAENRANAK